VLLGKLHPVVPSHVPFVLLVKRRLQRQQMVVPNAKRVKLRLLHLRLVSIVLLVQFLLPVTPLVPIVLRAKLLKLHLPHVKIVMPEKLRLLVVFVVIVVLVHLKMEKVVASALQVKLLLLARTNVPIVFPGKNLFPGITLVAIALRVKRRNLHLRHATIVLWGKRVTLEKIVLRCVLRVQLRPTVPSRVPIVLLVKHRLKVGLQTQNLVVPIVLRVKLRKRLRLIHFPNAPIVLSEKRVPLELTALRRALLVKRHPMVPPHVRFVLPVQSRLQRQQLVVPIARRMHFLFFHSLNAPTAQNPRMPLSLLPGTPLPAPLPQQQELQLQPILQLQNVTPVHFLLLVVSILPIRVHFVTLSTMLLLAQRVRVRPRPIKSLLERMELIRSTNVLRVIIGSRL